MAVERTFSIVKPDAVANNVIGKIYERFESVGLHIIGCKMLRLTRGQAEAFYEIHRERPFYRELFDYMVSGPVVVQVLEGEDAVAMNRQVMGQQTQPMRRQEPSVLTLLNRFKPTLFTGPMPRKLPPKRLHSFFRLMKYAIAVID